jgi:hypothetical protein
MRVTIPTSRFTLAAFLLAGLPAAAVAAPPGVLDRVPADADVVISVRQVSDFLADLDQVNRMLGENANPGMGFATAMVRGMPGLNLSEAAVLVVDLPADPNAMQEPTVVGLLPVKDFAAFSQGREAEDGVVTLAMPDSQAYARDIGAGYAVVSDNAEAVRAFDATKGRLAQHTARVGEAGGKVASDAEVAIILNAEALRPYINQGIEGMKQQGQMVAMMGGEQAAAGFNAFSAVAEQVAADLQAGVFGLSITEEGMTYDMSMTFSEGSDSAAYFSKTGATAGLLARVPADRYLFAMALDTSSPTVAKLGAKMDEIAKSMPEGAQGNFGQMSLAQLSELTDGVAFVMGTPPGLMGGGLFSNTTQYVKADDPDAYAKAMTDMLKEANGQANQGVTLTTTVTPDAITVAETPLTAYGVSMVIDPQAVQGGMPGMDPSMVTQMVFGPNGGPAGYLGVVDGGLVQTMSQGPELTRRAIAAAKGGEGLGANPRVRRAAAKLQDGRVAEIFVGVDEILNTVGPTLMMFGAVPEFQPVDAMDPVALGLSTHANGLIGRIHVPTATFNTIAKFIPAQPEGMDDNAGEEGFDF